MTESRPGIFTRFIRAIKAFFAGGDAPAQAPAAAANHDEIAALAIALGTRKAMGMGSVAADQTAALAIAIATRKAMGFGPILSQGQCHALALTIAAATRREMGLPALVAMGSGNEAIALALAAANAKLRN